MKKMFWKATSIILSLAIISGNINGYAIEAKNDVADPFISMVDVEVNDSTENNKVNKNAKFTEEERDRSEETKKTDRFIVKYKNSDSKFKSKAGNRIKTSKGNGWGKPKMKGHNKTLNRELIVLNEEVNPSNFAEELKALDLASEIEYIQPDFQMHFSEFTELNKTEGSRDSMAENEIAGVFVAQKGEIASEPDIVGVSDKDIDGSNSETESKENREVIVAVIDSAIDITHSKLVNHIWNNPGEVVDGTDNDNNGVIDDLFGYNSADRKGINNDDLNDKNNYLHGTHLAGVISGVAEEYGLSVKIMPVQAFNKGVGYTSDIINAIEYAVQNGAEIINLSFGSAFFNPALEETIRNTDALFICAAGNSRMNLNYTEVYPACIQADNVISVASVNRDDGFSYFSNYSPSKVHIAACGRDILGLLPANKTGTMTGTSVSAAYVSASVAAVMSACPEINKLEAKARLLTTADRLSNLQDKVSLGARVNLSSLLENRISANIIQVNPKDDFDVSSYMPLSTDEIYELFSITRVKQVTMGGNHGLALLDDGTVWAWGENVYGQLGDGSFCNSNYPVKVIGLSGIVDISAGRSHNLALDKNGEVYSWGRNNFGQLGIGSTVNSGIPVVVELYYWDIKATGIETGGNFSLISAYNEILLETEVYSFGENDSGQLGHDYGGGFCAYPEPVLYSGDVVSMAAGYSHALILDGNGTVHAWGDNSSGQLGNDTFDNIPYPMPLHFGATGIGAGSSNSYIIKNCTVDVLTFYSYSYIDDYGYEEWYYYPAIEHKFSGNEVPIAEIAAGISFAAARKSDGSVWVWGNNCYGRMGVGEEIEDSSTPVLIEEIDNAVGISAGGNNTLILRGDGSAWICGYNFGGVRDAGDAVQKTPVQVFGITGAEELRFDAERTLALLQGGGLLAWGRDVKSAEGMPRDSLSPVSVHGLPRIDVINNAIVHHTDTEIITYDKTWLYAWSGNGTPSKTIENKKYLKVQKGLHDLMLIEDSKIYCNQLCSHSVCNKPNIEVTEICDFVSGTDYVLAIKNNGTVWGWGNNAQCQLGAEAISSDRTPINITSYNSNLKNIVKISCYGTRAAALRNDGTVWVWGAGRGISRLQGVSDICDISVGNGHVLLLKADGSVFAYGSNDKGQLGNGTLENSSSLVRVSGLREITKVFAGNKVSGAIKADGTVWTWGNNSYGQIGNGIGIPEYGFNKVGGLNTYTDQMETAFDLGSINQGKQFIAEVESPGNEDYYKFNVNLGVYSIELNGNYENCSIYNQNLIKTADINRNSRNQVLQQLSTGTYYLKLSGNQSGCRIFINRITENTDILSVSAGTNHSLALDRDGKVWGWGSNDKCQLNEIGEGYSNPRVITGLRDMVAIAAGGGFSAALKSDGTVWQWGGYSENAITPIPTKIDMLYNIAAISAGQAHIVALRSDGTVWTLGLNDDMQLGDGTTSLRLLPAQVEGLNNIIAVSTGKAHNIALKSDGSVWAWGLNSNGQLGDGTAVSRGIPFRIHGLQNIIEIGTGAYHSFALSRRGDTYVWGNNLDGQLGNDETSVMSPTLINCGYYGVTATGGLEHSLVLSSTESGLNEVCSMGNNSFGQLGRNTQGEIDVVSFSLFENSERLIV